MFTTTGPERAAVAGATLDCHARLEMQDPDLNWVDVSTGLDTPDWFNEATISDSIDANAMSFAAELLRDTNSLSLAPLLESSLLNRNAANAYAPFLDLHRMWRVSVAVMPHGDAPAGGDWKEIGKGYIDSINVNDSNNASISVTGRGEEAIIIDAEILVQRKYSVGSLDAMETVIQALLDDNMGVLAPTIYVPQPMNFIITEQTIPYGSLMGTIAAVAAYKGAVIRYRYDSAGVNRLTLYQPLREAEITDFDWEIGPTEYLSLPINKLDISGVRNHIMVSFMDEASGIVLPYSTPSPPTSPSISRYGQRDLVINLAADSQITTQSRAVAFAQAIRSDLEFPMLQQQFETFGFWFVQLGDYGKLLPKRCHVLMSQMGAYFPRRSSSRSVARFRPSAFASRSTTARSSLRARPPSRALIVACLTPARFASSTWVSPAAVLSSLSLRTIGVTRAIYGFATIDTISS